MKSGSGIGHNQEPVNGQREDSKNGASDGAPCAVAAQDGADASSPSRLPAAPVGRPQEHVREQAGGRSRGTNGSSSATVGADQKGEVPAAIPLPEPPAPSSAGSSPSNPSLDSAWPFGAGTVSSAAVDCKEVFDRLVRAQAAINEAGRGSAEEGEKKKPEVEQVESSHPKKALWSKLKNYFTREIVVREEWEMYKEHVGHQTNPIAEVFDYYRVPDDMAICVNLDAYLRFRPVYGDGECFYRSFIFSYLEQVLDRQDTHEEHHLLDTIKRVSTQHANLGWTSSGFRRSYKAFKKLIKKVMGWKRQGRWNSIASPNSYRKEKLLAFFSTYSKTEDSEKKTPLNLSFLQLIIIHVSDKFCWLVFVFLRLVVAIQICSNGEEYGQLITGLSEHYSEKCHGAFFASP
ncbi:hypothetical protein ACQ4PT_035297 [Festuca glaucescens]